MVPAPWTSKGLNKNIKIKGYFCKSSLSHRNKLTSIDNNENGLTQNDIEESFHTLHVGNTNIEINVFRRVFVIIQLIEFFIHYKSFFSIFDSRTQSVNGSDSNLKPLEVQPI